MSEGEAHSGGVETLVRMRDMTDSVAVALREMASPERAVEVDAGAVERARGAYEGARERVAVVLTEDERGEMERLIPALPAPSSAGEVRIGCRALSSWLGAVVQARQVAGVADLMKARMQAAVAAKEAAATAAENARHPGQYL